MILIAKLKYYNILFTSTCIQFYNRTEINRMKSVVHVLMKSIKITDFNDFGF